MRTLIVDFHYSIFERKCCTGIVNYVLRDFIRMSYKKDVFCIMVSITDLHVLYQDSHGDESTNSRDMWRSCSGTCEWKT